MIENMSNLANLNLARGSFMASPPTRTSTASQSALILRLSLFSTFVDEEALEVAPPFYLSALHLGVNASHPIQPLLTFIDRITSLTLSLHLDADKMNQLLAESDVTQQLNFLSLSSRNIIDLDASNLLMIKQRIITLEVTHSRTGQALDKLIGIIDGSVLMEKVILDGLYVTATAEGSTKVTEMLRALKEACKTKGIELWRKNFPTMNGQVNLGA